MPLESESKKRKLNLKHIRNDDDDDHDDDADNENNNSPQLSDLLSYSPLFLSKLVERIRENIPDNDNLKYSTRLERLNWNNIVFDNHSVDECKRVWLLLQKNVRKFRLLSEIVDDINEWVKNIDTKHIQNAKAPKMPPNSYSLFVKDQREKIIKQYPNESNTEIFKIMGKLYKELPESRKQKYKDLAVQKRQQYNQELQEFYKNHPECVPVKKLTKLHKPPKRPRTPFEVFLHVEHEKCNGDEIDAIFTEDCRQKWNNEIADEDKMFYINWAQEEYDKYCADLKEYLKEHPQYKPPKVQVLTKQEKSIVDRLSGKPIKPPTSAFALFAKQLSQNDILKNVKGEEKMICITEQWHKLTDGEKDEYKIRIEQLWEHYQNELEKYLSKLPIDRRNELLNDKSYKKIKNKKIVQICDRVNQKVKKQLECPQTPPRTVFEFFLSVYNNNSNHDEDPTDVWQHLTEEQRRTYISRHNEIKRKYIVEYEEFLNSLSKKQLEYFAKYRKVLNVDDDHDNDENRDDDDDDHDNDENRDDDDEDGDDDNDEGGDEDYDEDNQLDD